MAAPAELIAALSAPDAAAVEAAAVALADLAQGADAAQRHAIVSAGALPALVNVLKTGSGNAQTAAARACGGLTGSSDICEELVTAGVLKPLVALMSGSCRAGHAAAADALRALSLNSYSGQLAIDIIAAGAAPALINCLAEAELDTEAAAAECLASLAESPACCHSLVDAGVLPPLVKLLAEGASIAVRETAADAILSLTFHGSAHQGPSKFKVCDALCEAGALDALVDVLTEGSDAAICDAAQALAYIARSSAKHREEVIEAGAQEPLAALAAATAKAEVVRVQAEQALKALAAH